MTVEQLIKKLQEFKPETEIMFSCNIESGYSSSHVGDASCNIDFQEVYEYQGTNEDGENEEMEKENVVLINVWGEESSFD
jgi:hypothetical protein